MATFKSIYGRELTVRPTTDPSPGSRRGGEVTINVARGDGTELLPNTILSHDTAHALIRELIAIVGEPAPEPVKAPAWASNRVIRGYTAGDRRAFLLWATMGPKGDEWDVLTPRGDKVITFDPNRVAEENAYDTIVRWEILTPETNGY